MADQTAGLVLQAARLLFRRPGDVVELRVFNAGRFGTIAGYFDDLEALAKQAAILDKQKFPGVYWTLNPLDPDLLARASNKTLRNCKPGQLTGDDNVLCLRWLYIDLDPKRLAGISATDEEKAAAMDLAPQIRAWLDSEGWPAPIFADSGNGSHLLYRIELPNEPASEDLLSRVLATLGARFNTAVVKVDQTTKNPSRICKVYGTMARKGDNVPTRPHRLSCLLHVPDELIPVPIELLHRLAGAAPEPSKPLRAPVPRSPQHQYSGPKEFDVQAFLNKHGIRHRHPVAHEGGWKYVLEECPFDSSHKAPDSAVFDRPDGFGFLCFHDSCHGRDWREFRALFEPGAYAPRPAYAGNRPPEPPLPPAPPELRKRAPAAAPPQEEPIKQADIEAAINDAIGRDDLVEVMRLAPELAKLKHHFRLVVKTKIKEHFGNRFSKSLEMGFDKAIAEACGRGETGQNPPAAPPPLEIGPPIDGPDLTKRPLTDGGNGERMALLFRDDARFCTEMKKWLIWDGRRWAIDEMNVMRQLGKRMARLLYAQAATIVSDGIRSKVEGWARASESYSGISNSLGQAATEPGIPISAHLLDAHPFLLNCPNGVVDLRTGELLPHNREFLITKLCPIEYDPAAECPQFIRFIEWAMGAEGSITPGDAAELSERTVNLVGYLQRALGYGLTGDVSQKIVFVFYGEGGNNGKTTLLTLFRDLLGRDYSNLLLIETVMAAKQTDTTARADMADLRGARFVQTSEVGREDRLNEQRIKYLTQGMGFIKSRRLYENPIEFEATHKLYMDCNHRPKMPSGGDEATWRRLKLVPFTITIGEEEKDVRLPDKLRTELPGILAWAVRGAIEWHKRGLAEPNEVSEAIEDWKQHDDPLKEFLDECCEVGDKFFVPVADLSLAYQWWSRKGGDRYALGRKTFNEVLRKKKFGESNDRRDSANKQFRAWEGLQLQTEVTRAIRRMSERMSESLSEIAD